ncbi:hypothetical protein [Desulfonema magnum]|nr:hypothetical protein [Desulfonema magnum]
MTSSTYAFYHSGEDKAQDLRGFENLGGLYSKISENKEKNTFVLYDNFNHVLPKQRQETIIFPYSDKFVPADLIEFNLPVYAVFHHSETFENPVTKLLYANLKLKKLLEEYSDLQRRVNALLSDLEFSSDDIQPDLLALINNIQMGDTPKLSEMLSVHRKWIRLNREISKLAKNHPRLLAESAERTASRLLAGIRFRANSYHSEKPSEMTSRNFFGPSPRTFKNKTSASDAPLYRHNTKDAHSVAVKRKKRDFYYEDDFLERMFKFPSKVLRYVLLNKIKAIVYGLVLIFMIYFTVIVIRSVIHR